MNHEVVTLPLKADLQVLVREIESPENKWFTGQKVGHDPYFDELVVNFINTGAIDRFRQKHRIQVAG